MPAITPCLWFQTEAAEAAQFYTGLFPNSRILRTTFFGEGAHMPTGAVMAVELELMGQQYLALNGRPPFPFNEAVSLIVPCETQAEIDHYWQSLTAEGGQPVQCGWLKDKYGVSWQITPTQMADWASDSNPAKARAVFSAMMSMVKIDLATLQSAYDAA